MVNQNKVVFCRSFMYFDVMGWKAIDQSLAWQLEQSGTWFVQHASYTENINCVTVSISSIS